MGDDLTATQTPLLYYYGDEYLANSIKESQNEQGVNSIENRAIEYIKQFNLKDDYQIKQLTILKAYILVCLENRLQEGDAYDMRLKEYKSEFDTLKNAAILMKQQDELKAIDANRQQDRYNIPLYRG